MHRRERIVIQGPAARASRPRVTGLAATALLALCLASHGAESRAASPTPLTLVVCAPGYPGSTEEAQATMDALAAAIAAAAKWTPGDLKAVYFETEQGGLDRLAQGDAALALVPLPFWLQHRARLALEPLMQAVEEGGQAAEPWTLVAAKGAVGSAPALAGYEIVSRAGYVPRFVRGTVLGAWGEVPPDAKVTFSTAVLTGLRRASTGAKVALVLDRAQAQAVPTLPFAGKLQVVTVSAPLPVSVLASVGGRWPAAMQKSLVTALASLASSPAGADALAGARLSRFVPADAAALGRAREAFDRLPE